jgi:ubiquinone/menaquinone biosynthesis C-methylase UbiE
MMTSEQRRAEWAARVERYAENAVVKNQPFAAAMVEWIAPPAGSHVLDIATGPGVVAVEAARRVGAGGSVLATDFLPDWEPYVMQAAAAAGVTNVRFATMPAEALLLPDASFDVVLCQFGLMFVPEPDRALREMFRVLRPGGRLGVAVWSVPGKVGIFLVPTIIGRALPLPTGSPSPMSMGEPGLIARLLTEAGFRDVRAQAVTRLHDITDPEAEWRSWADDQASPIGRALADAPAHDRQRLYDEAMAELEQFREGDRLRVPSEAIFATGTR